MLTTCQVLEGLGSFSANPRWKQASAMAACARSDWPLDRLLLEDHVLETLVSLLSSEETFCI